MAQKFDEDLFRRFIEHSLDAVAMIQRDGRVSYVSPAVTRIVGYSTQEFVALAAFEIVHPEDRDAAVAHFEELVTNPGSSQTAVNRVQHKDGSWKWIETVSTNHMDTPGVGAIIASFRDITEGMQAVEAIREAEEKFRGIVESATEFAIVTTDLDGNLNSWNSGASRLLGFEESEVLGQHCRIFFTPEDNAQDKSEGEMRDALVHGRGNDERWHVRKDGSRFWGSGFMMPLRDNAGNIRGYLKIFRDMTRAKRAEEALKEADRRKDDFLAMLAHELRNPLAAISNASMLLKMPKDQQAMAWASEVITRQSKYLSRLLDDLHDVSRVTRRKIRLQKERVDLTQILGRAIEAVRPLIDEKKHRVSLAISPDEIAVVGDPVRIEQALVNVLTNAAKYTDDGGHISVTAQRSDTAIVAIKDTGIGIESDMMARIFEPFVQAEQSLDRSQGGLGIGLTLSRSLLELHGGTVSVKSEGLGRGSEFWISLPLADESSASERATITQSPVPPKKAYRILVVDDNHDSADSLSLLLRELGYKTIVAYDGPSAAKLASSEVPDAVLLDIGLPGIDGYEVARQVRRDEKGKSMLLVAISGYGQDEDRRRSREAGFDHHLVKPVDFNQLASLLSADIPSAVKD